MAKILVRVSVILLLILLVSGVYYIHIELMLDNFGKVYWKSALGYWLYLSSAFFVGIFSVGLFLSTYAFKKHRP